MPKRKISNITGRCGRSKDVKRKCLQPRNSSVCCETTANPTFVCPHEGKIPDFCDESFSQPSDENPYNFQESIIYSGDISVLFNGSGQKHYLGEMVKECINCSAVNFPGIKGRSANSCCHKGNVAIPPLYEYPPYLKELLTSQTEEAKEFRLNIRGFNSSFAFATFSANFQNEGKCVPLIKIHGQVYRFQ